MSQQTETEVRQRIDVAGDCPTATFYRRHDAAGASGRHQKQIDTAELPRIASLAVLRDAARLIRQPELRLAIAAYTSVSLCLLGAALWFNSPLTVAVLVVLGWLLFPLTEYVVHRYVLHPLIYLDNLISARFWIRVHYAHHDRPSRTDVILASPVSVVMLVVVLNIPIVLIVGPAAIFAGALAIIGPFTFYEFVHFSAHAPICCTSPYLVNRQRLHLLHHFHNEERNFGICSSIVDRLVGTHAQELHDAERSATARNLGYDETLACEKPLVRIEYVRRYLGQ
jgi:sterol desaturase/sphingolipid hydroxylase (fatty acid hydroxylase superfamily)